MRGRGASLVLCGILFAAIIRASSKAADYFDDYFADGDDPRPADVLRSFHDDSQ